MQPHCCRRDEVLGAVSLPQTCFLPPALLHCRSPLRQPATLGNKPCQLCCLPSLPYLHFCTAAHKGSPIAKASQATAKCFPYKAKTMLLGCWNKIEREVQHVDEESASFFAFWPQERVHIYVRAQNDQRALSPRLFSNSWQCNSASSLKRQ